MVTRNWVMNNNLRYVCQWKVFSIFRLSFMVCGANQILSSSDINWYNQPFLPCLVNDILTRQLVPIGATFKITYKTIPCTFMPNLLAYVKIAFCAYFDFIAVWTRPVLGICQKVIDKHRAEESCTSCVRTVSGPEMGCFLLQCPIVDGLVRDGDGKETSLLTFTEQSTEVRQFVYRERRNVERTRDEVQSQVNRVICQAVWPVGMQQGGPAGGL